MKRCYSITKYTRELTNKTAYKARSEVLTGFIYKYLKEGLQVVTVENEGVRWLVSKEAWTAGFVMEVLGLPDCKISTVLKSGYKIII